MIPSRIEINFILSILNFIDRWALNFSEDDDGGNREPGKPRTFFF